MVNKEKITESEAENTVGNIKYTSDFDSILNADLVIEVVSENFKLKNQFSKNLT